jgi:hypothetical protein
VTSVSEASGVGHDQGCRLDRRVRDGDRVTRGQHGGDVQREGGHSAEEEWGVEL